MLGAERLPQISRVFGAFGLRYFCTRWGSFGTIVSSVRNFIEILYVSVLMQVIYLF